VSQPTALREFDPITQDPFGRQMSAADEMRESVLFVSVASDQAWTLRRIRKSDKDNGPDRLLSLAWSIGRMGLQALFRRH
jgi:hypothetical protein